jgi:hypothetical protein
MKNSDAIQQVQSTLINIALTNVSTATYTEFEAAGLKVISELKIMDKPYKGAVCRVDS